MTSVEIALTFSLRNTRDIPSCSNSKRLPSTAELKFQFTSAISEFGIILSLSCNIDNILTGINLLPYAAPIRSSVCQRTEFPKRTMISGRRIFFLPSPSPLSFFRPRTYRKGYYFYSPQSSTVIKSKMAATTIRARTMFRPPKIRLHCRLLDSR